MTRPFEKTLLSFCLLLMVLGWAGALPAQQTDGSLLSALREARETGIAEETLNRLLALGYEKQVEPSGMADLLLILARSQKEHLPLEPFLSKLEEGISKGIPASRIGKVLEARCEDYRFTRSLIQESGGVPGKVEPASAESLVRLTETLYCGLSRDNLASLMGTSPGTPLPVVLRGAEVLASLKQIRFDQRFAQQIVDTGLKQGYFTQEQRDFARIVALAKKKGLQDDQIAAAALAVMGSRGSPNDLSSRLGITERERARRGPQLGEKRTASESPGSSGTDLATSQSPNAPPGDTRQAAPSGTGSKSGDRASPGRSLNVAGTPAAGDRTDPVHEPGSGGGPNTADTSDPIRASDRIGPWETGKGSAPVQDANTNKSLKTTKTVDAVRTLDSTSRSEPVKGSNTAAEAATDSSPKTTKTADAVRTSDGKDASASAGASQPVHDSTVGNGSKPATGSVPIFRSGYVPKQGLKPDKRLTFSAAGTIVEIDPDTLSLTLDINEAYRVPEDYLAPFVINEEAVCQAECSELGVFEVTLDDLAIPGEYLRVLGRIQADGTYLVNRIVLDLDGITGPADLPSSNADQTDPVITATAAFAAVGTVIEIDPDALTLMLIVDKASRVLEVEVGGEARFSISSEAGVKTESLRETVPDWGLHDIPVGQDGVRVLGKRLPDGSLVISQIVVHLEE